MDTLFTAIPDTVNIVTPDTLVYIEPVVRSGDAVLTAIGLIGIYMAIFMAIFSE